MRRGFFGFVWAGVCLWLSGCATVLSPLPALAPLWRPAPVPGAPDGLRIEPRNLSARLGEAASLRVLGTGAADARCQLSDGEALELGAEGLHVPSPGFAAPVSILCQAGELRAEAQVTYTDSRTLPVADPYQGGVVLFKLRELPEPFREPVARDRLGLPSARRQAARALRARASRLPLRSHRRARCRRSRPVDRDRSARADELLPGRELAARRREHPPGELPARGRSLPARAGRRELADRARRSDSHRRSRDRRLSLECLARELESSCGELCPWRARRDRRAAGLERRAGRRGQARGDRHGHRREPRGSGREPARQGLGARRRRSGRQRSPGGSLRREPGAARDRARRARRPGSRSVSSAT